MSNTTAREHLQGIRRALEDHPQRTQRSTVRELLAWFGYQRRTRLHVREIRRALQRESLITEPDFDAVHIDAIVEYCPKPAGVARRIGSDGSDSSPDSEVRMQPRAEKEEESEENDLDLTNRVSRLPSANQEVLSLKPDDTLKRAITLMLTNDYSQLPVMTNERSVKGIVSWESIGQRLAQNSQVAFARDCMAQAQEVSSKSPLFEVVDIIIKSGAVLVRSEDNRVVGIVTTADLSSEFRRLGEPFLRIGEIERHLRSLLASVPAEIIGKAADPDSQRRPQGISDLTLGEMVRLIEDPAMWERTGLQLDRPTLLGELKQVCDIRNEVMHFDPEGLEDSQLDLLRRISTLLHKLQDMGTVYIPRSMA